MRSTPIWFLLTVMLALGSLLAGCGGSGNVPPLPSGATAQAQTTATVAETPPHATGVYPGPAVAPTTDLAYPVPSVAVPPPGPDPQPIPTPAQGTGVIHGKLYSSTSDQPIYDGVTVYLSKVIATQSADMDAVSLDREKDPQVSPDGQGSFAFGAVPPGRYGIVVQGPLNQYLTRSAANQAKDLIIKVEANQTLDVGKLYSGYP